MTTLKTIIEEEKKEFESNFKETLSVLESDLIKNFLTTAMQRAYAQGVQEERDSILAIAKVVQPASYTQETIIDLIEKRNKNI